MKNLAILLSLFILLSGCKDDEPDQPTEQPGAFVATIDGETIDFLYQTSAYFGTYDDFPAIFFTGSSSSNYEKELNISLIEFEGVGTYELGTLYNTAYYSTTDINNGEVTSYGTDVSEEPVGVVNVTSYSNNNVKGNFNVILINNYDSTIELTVSGTFNLNVSD